MRAKLFFSVHATDKFILEDLGEMISLYRMQVLNTFSKAFLFQFSVSSHLMLKLKIDLLLFLNSLQKLYVLEMKILTSPA